MNLDIFYIQKKLDTNEFATKYLKLISPHARVAEHNLFNKQISCAQTAAQAQAAYSALFSPKLANAFNIALSEDGAALNSQEFAALIKDKPRINFFIGGAYGLEKSFKNSCDFGVSLSQLTTTHELARILLLEQLYRACCINQNHPYHK